MSTTKVVAVRMGFYQGSRIRPGQAFEYEGATIPSWTVAAGSKPSVAVPKKDGDIKPPAAIKAVVGKVDPATLV